MKYRFTVLPPLYMAAALAAASPQTDADQLAALINAYRAAPGACQGAAAQAAAPLNPAPALAGIRVLPGMILSAALDRAGYASTQADAISVNGAANAQAAMQIIEQAYCGQLLSAGYTDIGVTRSGMEWTVVLATAAPPRPTAPSSISPDRPPVPLFDWQEAGQIILDGVNAARAKARTCGDQSFPPAPPLRWNAQLGSTALAHSQDMAAQRYFSHFDKQGKEAGDRARGAGYKWARIGENIAAGQHSPQEAVAGWLDSPGHCANIMNAGFTEMGAAYAVTQDERPAVIYWTQTFGKPLK